MQAALELPSVHKAVVNEPPLDVDNSIITMLQSFMPRFDREIADGKVAEAMVTLLTDFGALFLPGLLQPVVEIAPRSVLVWLFKQILRRDAEHVKGDDVPLKELIPTFHFDYELVVEMRGTLESFKAVPADVLLPDASFTFESMIAEGDFVAERWTLRGTHGGEFMGIPGTGKQVKADMVSFNVLVGSKIVERWRIFDSLDVRRQLEGIPASGAAEGRVLQGQGSQRRKITVCVGEECD